MRLLVSLQNSILISSLYVGLKSEKREGSKLLGQKQMKMKFYSSRTSSMGLVFLMPSKIQPRSLFSILLKICRIFAGCLRLPEKDLKKILFQLVDYRHLIIRAKGDRWWYFWESGGRKTYIEQLSDSFCFDSKLTAVCEGRFLYFRSFKNASMLFDLSKYMKEASVETVVEFLSHNSIETPENASEFAEAFNSTHKRLVSAVIWYGALDRLAPREIQVRAKKSRANVDIDISDSGKVIIPEDAVAREKVLQFLANVIVSSYLDDDSDYEAQATRRL